MGHSVRNFNLNFKIYSLNDGNQVEKFDWVKQTGNQKKTKGSLIKFPIDVPINRETKIAFYNNDNGKSLFYLWFHTKFIKSNELKFSLEDLDKPNRKEYNFQSNFSISLHFPSIPVSQWTFQKTRIERTKATQNRIAELGSLRMANHNVPELIESKNEVIKEENEIEKGTDSDQKPVTTQNDT